jgi:hypothetical protein
MGRKVPNLVYVYDSEKGSEFRVQLEMGLPDEAEATRVKSDVLAGTPAALKRAKTTVMGRIDPGASPSFIQMVSDAFDENIHLSATGARRGRARKSTRARRATQRKSTRLRRATQRKSTRLRRATRRKSTRLRRATARRR